LHNEGSTLLDSVSSLADWIDHERMRTDAKFLGRVDCSLLELIGKLE